MDREIKRGHNILGVRGQTGGQDGRMDREIKRGHNPIRASTLILSTCTTVCERFGCQRADEASLDRGSRKSGCEAVVRFGENGGADAMVQFIGHNEFPQMCLQFLLEPLVRLWELVQLVVLGQGDGTTDLAQQTWCDASYHESIHRMMPVVRSVLPIIRLLWVFVVDVSWHTNHVALVQSHL